MQVYSASKGGVVTFVQALAEPLSRKGIRLVAFCPQFVSTALVSALISSFPLPAALQHELST